MIATTTNSTSMVSANTQTKRTTWDGRLFLKVKLKSLAAESKIIRQEEKKGGRFRDSLWSHRTGIVRQESRATIIAYGFLRGLTYRQMEASSKEPADWKKVEAMVKKYGAIHKWEGVDWTTREKINSETMVRFQAWKEEALTAKKE